MTESIRVKHTHVRASETGSLLYFRILSRTRSGHAHVRAVAPSTISELYLVNAMELQ